MGCLRSEPRARTARTGRVGGGRPSVGQKGQGECTPVRPERGRATPPRLPDGPFVFRVPPELREPGRGPLGRPAQRLGKNRRAAPIPASAAARWRPKGIRRVGSAARAQPELIFSQPVRAADRSLAPWDRGARRDRGGGPGGAPLGPRVIPDRPGPRPPRKGLPAAGPAPGQGPPQRPRRIASGGATGPAGARAVRRGAQGGPGGRWVRPRPRVQARRARATDSSSRAVPTASSRVTGAGPPAAIAASRARTSSS